MLKIALVINIFLNQGGKSSHIIRCVKLAIIMPIFARFLTFYSEQYDESYVFKNFVFRSIYSIANLACLWAIIWYSSMLKTRPKEPGATRVATTEVHTEIKKVPRTTKTQTEKQNSGRKAALNKLLVLREQKRKSKSKK